MRHFTLAAFALLSSPAYAGSACFDAAGPIKWIADHHGAWARLSTAQWQFLRGVSAMNPLTPAGLPFGEAAALATFPGQETAEVFFLDGDQACSPMPIPKVLVDLLTKVGDETITHEGKAM